jgi:cyclopropane fatty-acyl-phospholipid synthase-like methyltransferase
LSIDVSFFKKIEIADPMNRVNAPLHKLVSASMKLSDHDRLLAIGFGNGRFFSELMTKAKHLQVYGLELSEEMMKEAADLNSGLNELPRGRTHEVVHLSPF